METLGRLIEFCWENISDEEIIPYQSNTAEDSGRYTKRDSFHTELAKEKSSGILKKKSKDTSTSYHRITDNLTLVSVAFSNKKNTCHQEKYNQDTTQDNSSQSYLSSTRNPMMSKSENCTFIQPYVKQGKKVEPQNIAS